MGSLGNDYENKLLEHITGKAYTASPTAYLALAVSDFGETGVTTYECITTNAAYMRQATSSGHWGAAASGAIVNAGAITYSAATTPWMASNSVSTINSFALWDNATPGSGSMIAYGTISPVKVIASGDTVQFAANAISITAD